MPQKRLKNLLIQLVPMFTFYGTICPPLTCLRTFEAEKAPKIKTSRLGEKNGVLIKQGRIHSRISRVRLGRSSDAKTAQKTPKKQMLYKPTVQPTDQWTDTVGYRVACTRLKTIEMKKLWTNLKVMSCLQFLEISHSQSHLNLHFNEKHLKNTRLMIK